MTGACSNSCVSCTSGTESQELAAKELSSVARTNGLKNFGRFKIISCRLMCARRASVTTNQKLLSSFSTSLQHAAVPAWDRAGPHPLGVFRLGCSSGQCSCPLAGPSLPAHHAYIPLPWSAGIVAVAAEAVRTQVHSDRGNADRAPFDFLRLTCLTDYRLAPSAHIF